MSTVWPFLVKFASLIVCTLHCFDRVIFKGHLALSAPCELEYFVDRILKGAGSQRAVTPPGAMAKMSERP
jgi:hypothetical protein